jgi:hypothetical protein
MRVNAKTLTERARETRRGQHDLDVHRALPVRPVAHSLFSDTHRSSCSDPGPRHFRNGADQTAGNQVPGAAPISTQPRIAIGRSWCHAFTPQSSGTSPGSRCRLTGTFSVNDLARPGDGCAHVRFVGRRPLSAQQVRNRAAEHPCQAGGNLPAYLGLLRGSLEYSRIRGGQVRQARQLSLRHASSESAQNHQPRCEPVHGY